MLLFLEYVDVFLYIFEEMGPKMTKIEGTDIWKEMLYE